MTIMSFSFLIAIVLAVACAVLCFIENKTNKTKVVTIIIGTMCYFATCFFFGLVAGYY